MHRAPTVTRPPTLRAQAAGALALLATAWVLTHLAVALPALALGAAVAYLWLRRDRLPRPRPTKPPD